MASRQSVSSILKPPKVRPPLKEIESVDQDADENTATISKRKVSFSGMNKIKMYNTGATSLTVHQTPMFDEQLLSDSSNAEKTNLSSKFDGQVTFESTVCTNVEDNGRVIIEYESPNDNMEITEAIIGKISSDTIYTIDNNGPEHINYSSDYSVNNMEFTEAIKVVKILNADIESDVSVTEMSETLNNKCEQPETQYDLQSLVSLPNMVEKNTSNVSSNMNFTCANIKHNSLDLTCVTGMSSKSIWLSDDNKSCSMELSQLPDRQKFEENYELVYDCSMESEVSCENNENSNFEPCIIYECNMESEVSSKFNEKSNCDSHILQNPILCTKQSEINNYSNHQTISSEFNNSSNDDKVVEQLSISVVSMDIDPTSEGNEYDINYVNDNNSELVANKQNISIVPTQIGIENKDSGCPVESIQYNYLNEIDINLKNNRSGRSMVATGSSFVEEENINKSTTGEVLSLKEILYAHTSIVDDNKFIKDTSLVIQENPQKNYSRKTNIYTNSLIDQEKYPAIEDTSVMVEENEQKIYSRSSITPTFNLNQTQYSEKEDIMSDTSLMVEENQQKMYPRKSIAATSNLSQTQYFENDGIISDESLIVEENQYKRYSRKSIAPTCIVSQTESFENGGIMSDTSIILKENQQKIYPRKSIAPTSNLNQTEFFENEGMPDTTVIVEENQEKLYPRKSIITFTSNLNQTQSFENDGIMSDTSVRVADNQQKINLRKSITPISNLNQTKFFENEGIMPDTTVIVEENQEKLYPRKSIDSTFELYQTQNFESDGIISDKSLIVEENQHKRYSRKSIAPTCNLNQTQSFENDGITSDTSIQVEENYEKICCKSIASEFDLNQTRHLENNDIMSDTSIYSPAQSIKEKNSSDSFIIASKNQLKRYSRKSVGPSSILPQNEPSKDSMSDDDKSLMIEESNKVSIFVNNLSLISNNSSVQQLDLSNQNEQIVLKSEHQSVLINVISDEDDFNSPFRKKSRKTVGPTYLTQLVDHTKTFDEENISETINEDNFSENFVHESKMDVSIELESKNENKGNISLHEKSMNLTTSLNSVLPNSLVNENQNLSSLLNDSIDQKSKVVEKWLNKENNSNQFLDTSKVVKLGTSNIIGGGEFEMGKEISFLASNEKRKNKTNLNQLVKNNEILKEYDEINKEETSEETNNESIKRADDICNTDCLLTSIDYSSRQSIDKNTNDISKLSISNEIHQHVEKSFIENRKRSYSNRVGAPMLCSSFISKPNIHNCTNEEFTKEDFINGSPIKSDITKDNSINEESLIENGIVVDPIKEEFVKEHLSNTVLEFLSRWNEQFIENILVLDKCTNSEWIFNVLDNIILKISYSPIVNNDSFLKVADILLNTRTTPQNEIIKFGINWILSKYNPKVYKQICFTSRDIELLLKSLLEDVQFINMVMKNMFFIRDVYCVTFKDNKVQFVLHNINPWPLMAHIEISLSNIHKISVKDITVDCLFGVLNTTELNGIMESVTKDCNVLQSLIEKIRKMYSHK